MMSRQPYYLAHAFMPLMFCSVYLVWSIIYWACGGGSIYGALDWNDPISTGKLVAFLLLIGLPVLHILFFCIVRGRDRCRGNRMDAEALQDHGIDSTQPAQA